MIEDSRLTLAKLIAKCQALTGERAEAEWQGEHRPPPPMQSFVSGPPKWLFWLFGSLLGVVAILWACLVILALCWP